MSTNTLNTGPDVRWLTREEEQQRDRLPNVDWQAFRDIAARAVGSSCVSVEPFAQGGYNSLYSLAFENGKEAIARFPHKFVKEPHLVIASEVATMDFLRQKLGLPIPEVYGWSKEAMNNEMQTEYILMEKMPGIRMDDSTSLTKAVPQAVYAELVDMQTRLAGLHFSAIGSLFYKDDMQLPSFPLFGTDGSSDDLSKKFCIGPSVHDVFRRLSVVDGGRPSAGPWEDANSYWHAILDSELAMIPRYRTSEDARTPGDGLYDEAALRRMIDFYRHAVDQLCPPPPYERRFCAWHPELYPRNVLFDPVTERITALLDWQEAIVAPLFYQVEAVPGCFQDPPKSSDSEPPESDLKALYKTLTQGTVMEEILKHPLRPFAIDPLSLFWASKGFNVTRCREQWVVNWYLFWTPDKDDAPLVRPDGLLPYDEVDSKADIAAVQAWRKGQEAEAQVLERLGVEEDGRCDAEEYEEKKKLVAAVHAQYLAEGGDPDWWPFDS